MRIVVAGMGAVGNAVYASLDKHPNINVVCDDPAMGKHNEDLNVDGVVGLCVATPQAGGTALAIHKT